MKNFTNKKLNEAKQITLTVVDTNDETYQRSEKTFTTNNEEDLDQILQLAGLKRIESSPLSFERNNYEEPIDVPVLNYPDEPNNTFFKTYDDHINASHQPLRDDDYNNENEYDEDSFFNHNTYYVNEGLEDKFDYRKRNYKDDQQEYTLVHHNFIGKEDTPHQKYTKFADNSLTSSVNEYIELMGGILKENKVDGFESSIKKVLEKRLNDLKESDLIALSGTFINLLSEGNSKRFKKLQETYHIAYKHNKLLKEYSSQINEGEDDLDDQFTSAMDTLNPKLTGSDDRGWTYEIDGSDREVQDKDLIETLLERFHENGLCDYHTVVKGIQDHGSFYTSEFQIPRSITKSYKMNVSIYANGSKGEVHFSK